ncbi:MAG: hypothetical protein FVQ77_10670 [Cytophagales bacterium]|nr:hypothetical protein [Cytophagales bacterium]
MLKIKLFILYISFKSLFCGCHEDKRKAGFIIDNDLYKIKKIAVFLKKGDEPSGLELADKSNGKAPPPGGVGGASLWTHNDGGGKNVLLKIDMKGKTQEVIAIPNTTNIDWEDLAKDDNGYIYIGDFGNNNNQRKNLRIYKFKEIQPGQQLSNLKVDTISFYYADQKTFPPQKKFRNYDCEAFFWHRQKLFLFTKNRGNKYVKMYVLPDKPGFYIAELIDSIHINTMITAADISPDGKLVALLGYGKIYLFDVENEKSVFDCKHYCFKIPKGGQAEGLVFINDTDFVFSNERGRLFLAERKYGRK